MFTIILLAFTVLITGFFIEVMGNCISGTTPKLNAKLNHTKRLIGWVSIWMAPVYLIFMPLVFPPIYNHLIAIGVPFYLRYFVWAFLFTGVEILTGWFYDKALLKITRGKFSVKPWTFTGTYKDSVFNGYTRLGQIPLWGVAGLFLEFLYSVVVKISPSVHDAIVVFFNNYK